MRISTFVLTTIKAAVRIWPLVVEIGDGSAIVQSGITTVHKTWRFRRSGGLLLAGLALCTMPGCLQLGGRTTYVQQSAETEARLTGLETRVGALEQALATRSAAPIHLPPGEPIIGQAAPPQQAMKSTFNMRRP